MTDITQEVVNDITEIKSISLKIVKEDPRFDQALEKLAEVIVPLNATQFGQQLRRFILILESQKLTAFTNENNQLKTEVRELIGQKLNDKVSHDNEKQKELISAITDFYKVIPPKLA